MISYPNVWKIICKITHPTCYDVSHILICCYRSWVWEAKVAAIEVQMVMEILKREIQAKVCLLKVWKLLYSQWYQQHLHLWMEHHLMFAWECHHHWLAQIHYYLPTPVVIVASYVMNVLIAVNDFLRHPNYSVIHSAILAKSHFLVMFVWKNLVKWHIWETTWDMHIKLKMGFL